MLDKQLIKQLSSLKEIKKSPVLWRDQTRQRILQLAEQQSSKTWVWQDKVLFDWWQIKSRVPQPVFASLVTVVLLLILSMPIGKVALASLPGSWLYPVKRFQEKVALTFKQDAASQGAYYLHLAQLRLGELKQMPIGDSAQADLLRDYNINLSFAQANFEAAGSSAKLASLYDQSVSKFDKELNEVVVPAQDSGVYQTARQLTREIENRSLVVLVSAHLKDPEIPSTVAERLSQEINKVEQKLATVQSKLDKLPTSQKQAARVVIESKKQVVGAQAAGDEVSKTLAEAKELLEKKEFTLALAKVKECEVITLKTEEVLSEVTGNEPTSEVKGVEDKTTGEIKEEVKSNPATPSDTSGLSNTNQETLNPKP